MTEATSGQATTDAAPAATAASTDAGAAATTSAPATDTTTTATAASTDAAAASTTTTETATTTAEPSTPVGAPEKYEFKPTDGITFDDKVIGKYAEVAKELNLTQEGAQKVLTEVAPLIAQQQAEKFKATVEGWEAEAKADKEIGGEKLTENLALAKKGVEAHFSKDFVKLLDETGLGNHPEMIRGFMKIGKLVSQDRFVPGGSGATPLASAADKLYSSNT